MAALNIPILSIPVYYALATATHGWAIHKAAKGDASKHDNRNPKSTSFHESLKKRLTAKEFAAFERAESCHRNHLENMPLFIATIFAGLLAEQRVGEGQIRLLQFVIGWMVIRVLYTINYVTVETMKWSYLRSVLYFMGTGWSFVTLYKAAVVLGS